MLMCGALLVVGLLALPSHSFAHGIQPAEGKDSEVTQRIYLALPPNLKKLNINIGPNTSPLIPPSNDPTTGVLAVEANIGVANHLRETLQKQRYASRFFVINCAIAGSPLAGGLSTFYYYNSKGGSSSLAVAKKDARGRSAGFADRTRHNPSDRFGPGPTGMDFVPVLSLDALINSIPSNISIPYLMTDTQGFDLAVIKSASKNTLRRIKRLRTETYLKGVASTRYEGVQNELYKDWVPYMKSVGYRLENPTNGVGKEYDALWVRVD